MARAEIQPILLFRLIENHRRTFDRAGGSAAAIEADPSGEENGGGSGAALPLALDSGAAGRFSGVGVGS
jgi:hypothetical protein